MVPVFAYIVLSAVLFAIGVTGVLVKRSALVIFMSIELMLNAVNLALAAFSRQHAGPEGQVFVFFVMAVAAAEAAAGLAIIIAVFRRKGSTDVTDVHLMRW
ncbi:MAG: NADH-quinone oxidoreductase subunit NuoK [Acidobacteriota bacterium]